MISFNDFSFKKYGGCQNPGSNEELNIHRNSMDPELITYIVIFDRSILNFSSDN